MQLGSANGEVAKFLIGGRSLLPRSLSISGPAAISKGSRTRSFALVSAGHGTYTVTSPLTQALWGDQDWGAWDAPGRLGSN